MRIRHPYPSRLMSTRADSMRANCSGLYLWQRDRDALTSTDSSTRSPVSSDVAAVCSLLEDETWEAYTPFMVGRPSCTEGRAKAV